MAIVKRKEWRGGGMAWDWDDDLPQCDHCGKNAEETELSGTAHSGGVICGDIECWNDYMMCNVWNEMIESTEVDVLVCDRCGEDESQIDIVDDYVDCSDGSEDVCVDCLEDDHTEQQINEMKGK